MDARGKKVTTTETRYFNETGHYMGTVTFNKRLVTDNLKGTKT